MFLAVSTIAQAITTSIAAACYYACPNPATVFGLTLCGCMFAYSLALMLSKRNDM